MRRSLGILAIACVLVFASTGAKAQVIVSGPFLDGPAVFRDAYPAVPYSYFAAYPFPARGYVGFGTNDYPFYGLPYGRPNDPWSWPYLSGYYATALARYYYPPVQ